MCVGSYCIKLILRDRNLVGISSSVLDTPWYRCCWSTDEMGAFPGHLHIHRRGGRQGCFVCAGCQRVAPNLLFFNGSALLKTDNELNVHQIYSCSGNHCNCAKAHWTIFSTDANPTALFSSALKGIQELEHQFYRTGTQLWKYNGKLKLKTVITKASQYTETLIDAWLISEEAIYNTITRNPGVIIITALWN